MTSKVRRFLDVSFLQSPRRSRGSRRTEKPRRASSTSEWRPEPQARSRMRSPPSGRRIFSTRSTSETVRSVQAMSALSPSKAVRYQSCGADGNLPREGRVEYMAFQGVEDFEIEMIGDFFDGLERIRGNDAFLIQCSRTRRCTRSPSDTGPRCSWSTRSSIRPGSGGAKPSRGRAVQDARPRSHDFRIHRPRRLGRGDRDPLAGAVPAAGADSVLRAAQSLPSARSSRW